MPFNKLSAFTQKVADAADQLTGNPAGTKAIFDAAPEELRTYFNNLIDALKSTADTDSGAKNLGAKAITGLTGTDVQTILESLKTTVDAKVVASGESMTVIEASFGVFTANTANSLTVTVNFPTAFQNPPVVLPGNITQAVAYCDTMQNPYITNVTNTSFSVTLKTVNSSNYFGVGNLKMKFLVFGK
jgi:hypothetical protein